MSDKILVPTLPDDLRDFFEENNGVFSGVPSKRSAELVDPSGSPATITGGVNVRYLPSNDVFVGGDRYVLSLVAQPLADGSTYCRFRNGIACLIHRVTSFLGSTKIYEIVRFNKYFSMLHYLNSSPDANNAGFLGYGDATARNAWGATARRYHIPLYTGFEDSGAQFPAPFVKNQQAIEILFADARDVIETDGTNPRYTVTATYIMTETFVHPQGILADVEKEIREGGYTFTMKGVDHYELVTPVGASQSTHNINETKRSVERLLFSEYPTSSDLNVAVNDVMEDFRYNGLNNFQFRINNENVPKDPIDASAGGADAFLHLTHSLHRETYPLIDAGLITSANYVTNKFIGGFSFSSHGASGAHLVNGRDTTKTNQITLTRKYSAPLGSEMKTELFVIYDKIITITPSGDVVLNE